MEIMHVQYFLLLFYKETSMEIDLCILQLLLIQLLIQRHWDIQAVYQSITIGKTLYNERYLIML